VMAGKTFLPTEARYLQNFCELCEKPNFMKRGSRHSS
jgi:hypothetical protein